MLPLTMRRDYEVIVYFESFYMACMILLFVILLNFLLTANLLHAAQMTLGS